MKFGMNHIAPLIRRTFILVMLGATLLGTNFVNAATITAGSEMTVLGDYVENSDTGGSYITLLTAGSSLLATGDLAITLPDFDGTIIGDGKVYINPFTPTADILEVGGWYLSLNSLTITPSDVLTMSGTGQLFGNGKDSTAVTWSFSGGDSYSMTVTAVPVPAAVWLFGSGLVGLIAVARRKIA